MAATLSLNAQELEFANACREFVMEKDAFIGSLIVIRDRELAVPDEAVIRRAFVDIGLLRLLKVIMLAIGNNAVDPETGPRLAIDLASFAAKICREFSVDSRASDNEGADQ